MTQEHTPLPYCERDPKTDADFCEQDVHGWFQLSYASYLVLPRVLMQEMDAEWQHAVVNLLEQAHREFPNSPSTYTVLLRDESGRFISDPLRNYRYPDDRAIEDAKEQS